MKRNTALLGLLLPAALYVTMGLLVLTNSPYADHVAYAQTTGTGQPGGTTGTGQPGGTTGTGAPGGGSKQVDNPIGFRTISDFISALLRAVIQIGLPIAVLFIVYAGFKFVAARGNSEELANARRNFLWTVVGIAIFLGAWVLAQLIAATLRQLGANV